MDKNGEGGSDGGRNDGKAHLPRSPSAADRRRARLAAELRANLLKRKAQARSRPTASGPDEDGDDPA